MNEPLPTNHATVKDICQDEQGNDFEVLIEVDYQTLDGKNFATGYDVLKGADKMYSDDFYGVLVDAGYNVDGIEYKSKMI